MWGYRDRIAFITFSICTAVQGIGAGEVDKDKLRKLSKPPRINLRVNFDFSGKDLDRRKEPIRRAEVERIKKSLKGDETDAERLARLAELHRLLGDTEEAKGAARGAAGLYRKLLKKDPGDPKLLAGLGTALSQSEEYDEASAVLRKAVEVGPREWRTWAALAEHFQGWIFMKLFEGINYEIVQGGIEASEEELESFLRQKDAPDRAALAGERMAKVSAAYDRAVDCAPPGEGEPYRLRGQFRATAPAYIRAFHRALAGKRGNFKAILAEEMEGLTDAAFDFEEFARRRPHDDSANLQAVTMSLRSSMKGGFIFVPTLIPEDLMKCFQEAMGRLEKLSLSGDAAIAVRSLELLATLRYFSQDVVGVEKCVRSALAIDPSRESLWDVLYASHSARGKEEAISFLKEELKAKDFARKRYILAGLLEEDQPEEAEAEMEAALRLDPEGFYPNLGMAALILRRSKGEGGFDRAWEILSKLKSAYRDSLELEDWISLNILIAIFYGLTGHEDFSRRFCKIIFDYDPENARAKEVLAALGGAETASRKERDAEISIEEARKYYEAHPEEFKHSGELTFRMISIDENPEAPGILQAIDKELDEKPFLEVCRKHYAAQGRGEEPFLWRKTIEDLRDWVDPLRTEILSMKPGEVKRRIRVNSGWRYVEMVGRKPGGIRSFEEVQRQIMDKLRADRRKADQGKASGPSKK